MACKKYINTYKIKILLITILIICIQTRAAVSQGKGDKQLKISLVNYYSDLYAASDKYILDRFAFGIEYEYGLSKRTSILIPIQLSYQSQFLYLAPRIKFYGKKTKILNPSFDIAIVYNKGRQEVCDHIRSNYSRITDIKRNRLGTFLGFSLNPKLSKKISLSIQSSIGTYIGDNAKKYDGDSCGEFFLIDVMPRTNLSLSLSYNLTKRKEVFKAEK